MNVYKKFFSSLVVGLFLVVSLVLSGLGCQSSESIHGQSSLELEAKCAELGQKLYEKDDNESKIFADGEKAPLSEQTTILSPQFHLNLKINKCLYGREFITSYGAKSHDVKTITDVFENKNILWSDGWVDTKDLSGKSNTFNALNYTTNSGGEVIQNQANFEKIYQEMLAN